MRFTFSAVYLTALLSTLVTSPVQSAAVPHEARALQLEKRAAPYPEDATIRKALTDFNGPSVFFSNLAPTTQAQRDAPDTFAATVQGRTVKRAFGNQPAPNQKRLFTDQWPGPGRSPNYQDFADRFSRIFAEQSKGDTAFVLLRALDGLDGPKVNSVWNVHELPALKANPNIKKIIRVNPTDFNDQQQIFPEVAAPPPPPADAAATPAPIATPAPVLPQLKARKLGGFRLGGGGGGGFRLGGGSKKPPKSVADTPAPPPTSKAAAPPPPPSSSKPPPPPPSSSSAPPPPPPSSSKTESPATSTSAPASSSSTPAVASSSASSSSAPAASTASSTSAAATPVSSATSSSASASTPSSSASSSSASITSAATSTTTPASTTTTSSASTSSTAPSLVALDWDNPKDGPYYNAILP